MLRVITAGYLTTTESIGFFRPTKTTVLCLVVVYPLLQFTSVSRNIVKRTKMLWRPLLKNKRPPHTLVFFVVVVKVIERTVIFFNDDVHLREILQRAINYINAKFFVCTGLRIQYKFPTYLYFILLGRNIVECHSKHTTVDFRRERAFQSCYQNNINHTCRLGCVWIVIRILFLKTKTSNDTVS